MVVLWLARSAMTHLAHTTPSPEAEDAEGGSTVIRKVDSRRSSAGALQAALHAAQRAALAHPQRPLPRCQLAWSAGSSSSWRGRAAAALPGTFLRRLCVSVGSKIYNPFFSWNVPRRAATCRDVPRVSCRAAHVQKNLRLQKKQTESKTKSRPEEVCRSRKGEGGRQNELLRRTKQADYTKASCSMCCPEGLVEPVSLCVSFLHLAGPVFSRPVFLGSCFC